MAAWLTGAPLTLLTLRLSLSYPGLWLGHSETIAKTMPQPHFHPEGPSHPCPRKPECVHGPGGRAMGGLCQHYREALPGLMDLRIERKISAILEWTIGTRRGKVIYTQWNHRGKIVDRQDIDPKWIGTERNVWWWNTDMSNPSVQWNDSPDSPEPKSCSLFAGWGEGSDYMSPFLPLQHKEKGGRRGSYCRKYMRTVLPIAQSWVGEHWG